MNNDSFIKSGPIEKSESASIYTSFFTQVYGWMALGLLITAIVATVLSQVVLTNSGFARTISSLIFPLFLAELVIVWIISARTGIASVIESGVFFIIYSISNGIFFSLVLASFGFDVAGVAFMATFITFAIMSIYGTVAKQDLTKWGNIAIMVLIAGIIGSLVNLFIGSESMSWIITYVLLGTFIVLVAYDTQKLKTIANRAESTNIPVSKFAVAGALELYLDFINLFLLILKILGGRRR